MGHLMRILGLDIGDKRIGVAVSDETGIIANAIGVIERKDLPKDINRIGDLVKEYKCKKVVAGVPLKLNGTKSKQTDKVNSFIEKIKDNIDIPVIPFDERLSTVEAERLLIIQDVSRKKRKGIVDSLAAQIILQTYLNM